MTVTIEKNAEIKLTGFGARLKTAREALRLSDKDAAARLHLNPKIISIIENERFENGPPMIFMRGYLRSYARLLNVSDDEINVALSQLEMANPAVAVATQRVIQPQPSSGKSMRWMTYLVVLILITLVAMWWRNTHTNNTSLPKPANETPAETISQSNTQAPVVALNSAVRPVTTPTVTQPATAPEQPAAAPTEATTAPATEPTAHAALSTPALAEPAPQLAPTAPPKAANTSAATTPEVPPVTTDIAPKPETASTPPATPTAEASTHKVEPTKAAEPDLAEAKMELPEPGIEPGDEDAPTIDEGN
ncbi:MAG: helix-turn-helix domain-containing protein [Gammaproteobacteria bacterium]|nr:helix-turn-helix domain-containing protein [Gammaproteobacteria bacterium]